MTQENKELLLIDICSRLPYKQICVYKNSSYEILGCLFNKVSISKPILSEIKWVDIEDCTPYLRPMSNMIEEEKEELRTLKWTKLEHYTVDWLNAHHFDYRSLIPKGLALEAPEDMYKTE